MTDTAHRPSTPAHNKTVTEPGDFRLTEARWRKLRPIGFAVLLIIVAFAIRGGVEGLWFAFLTILPCLAIVAIYSIVPRVKHAVFDGSGIEFSARKTYVTWDEVARIERATVRMPKLAKLAFGKNEVIRVYPSSNFKRESSTKSRKWLADWPISYKAVEITQDFDEALSAIARLSNVEIVDLR